MAIPNSISPEQIELIDSILGCIASNARTMKSISSQILEHCCRNEEVASLADALGCVAASVGYMADEGTGKLGGLRSQDVEDWFLPPVLQSANNPDASNDVAQQPVGSVHHD